MTYLLFVNGKYFSSTRKNAEAFQWRKDWESLGYSVGLKFVRDDDKEAFRWLVPPEAVEEMRLAA
tara:strand:- start:1002 stop:1196 length:195 start_codon:yes stop_codon:yes gene_type:complete